MAEACSGRCQLRLVWAYLALSCCLAHMDAPAAIEPHIRMDMTDDLLDVPVVPWRALAAHARRRLQARQSRALLQEEEPEAGRPDFQRRRERRCRMALDDWCGQYEAQELAATKPPPRGSKPCPKDCSGVGNCNYGTGICDCPAGWTGEDCATVLRRPCTNRYRESGSEPRNHTTPEGRDSDWLEMGWRASRCGGICDDTIAMCYCDHPVNGRVLPPPGSPPGTPPVRQGRMLGDQCKPKTTWDNQPVGNWGVEPYDRMYGKDGWCNVTVPRNPCGCVLDGYHGEACTHVSEHFCINQCSGRGTCNLGFCKCYDGWYGTDCSLLKAGLPYQPSDVARGKRPWLAGVVVEPPAAVDPPTELTRRRPFIYIYDLPSEFNTRLLQYRIQRQTCMFRLFTEKNNTKAVYTGYGAETVFDEVLRQSDHRTYDPEEADFFYVPLHINCLLYPVMAWSDFPWYNGPLELRPLQGANFMMAALEWIRKTYPWWDRRQGRDHVWMTPHDEGACWAPSAIYNTSVILTNWGRMDLNHRSDTAYDWDNYTRPMRHPEWQPQDWRKIYMGHPCYTPGKDLVIPSYKLPDHYSASPLMGAPWKKRDILIFFRGDVGTHRLPWYSRKIRQTLYQAAKDGDWLKKYNILIGATHDAHVSGGYSELLSRSKFALVAPGDGWSGRAEDAILHGCIPVVIQDQVHSVYESILDWERFGLRIEEKSMLNLPIILTSIPDAKVALMQRRIARIWSRFAWASGGFLSGYHAHVHDRVLKAAEGQPSVVTKSEGLRSVQKPWPVEEDAFHTIMAGSTRASPTPAEAPKARHRKGKREQDRETETREHELEKSVNGTVVLRRGRRSTPSWPGSRRASPTHAEAAHAVQATLAEDVRGSWLTHEDCCCVAWWSVSIYVACVRKPCLTAILTGHACLWLAAAHTPFVLTRFFEKCSEVFRLHCEQWATGNCKRMGVRPVARRGVVCCASAPHMTHC